MSQQKLANRLDLTRASIVNIEAGRQRAPVHVLWNIAAVLGTELISLIPSPKELVHDSQPMKLDEETVKQIEMAAGSDPVTKKNLENFIARAKSRLEDT